MIEIKLKIVLDERISEQEVYYSDNINEKLRILEFEFITEEKSFRILRC